MNIKDLKPDQYKVIQPASNQSGILNVNDPDVRSHMVTAKKQATSQPKHGNFLTSVSDFVGSTKLGQGLSTLFDKNTQNTVEKTNTQASTDQDNLIRAIHNQVDPAKKQHLVDTLKNVYGQNYKANESKDINEGFGLSNKEILGSAGQTALSALSFGELSGGAKAGGLVEKFAPKVAEIANDTTKIAKPLLEGGGLTGKVARNAALGYGFDVTNAATNNKDNIFKPGFGTALGATLPVVSKLLGTGLKKVLGATTGTGSQIIDRAVKNPDEVFNSMKKYNNEESKVGLVNQAKEAIKTYLNGRNTEFGNSVSNMTSKAPISKSIILDTFSSEADKFGGQVKGNTLKFGDTALNSSEQKQLQNVWDIVKSWKDVTPKGMDTLRQRIGNEMDNFALANNGRDSVVLGNVKKAFTNVLKDNIEGYDKILGEYGNKTQTAKNILKELSLGGNTKPSTQLNQVMKVFKKDPAIIENLSKIMGPEKLNSFLNELSGANLASWVPASAMQRYVEGTLGAGEILALITGHISLPTVLASAATASPKVVGTASTLTGKILQKGAGIGTRRLLTKSASKLNK